MPRNLYVPTFIVLAAMFVPVILDFGVVGYVVPSIWIAVFVGGTLFHAELGSSLWAFGHLAVYFLLFYAAARATFWLSRRLDSQAGRSTIQVAVLLALFSCSFLRAITYSSIQGQGGTYTFWGAVFRYVEKDHSR